MQEPDADVLAKTFLACAQLCACEPVNVGFVVQNPVAEKKRVELSSVSNTDVFNMVDHLFDKVSHQGERVEREFLTLAAS